MRWSLLRVSPEHLLLQEAPPPEQQAALPRLKLKQVLKFKRMNARNELMKLCSPLQRLHKIHPKSSGSHGFRRHCQRFHQFHCGGLNALEVTQLQLSWRLHLRRLHCSALLQVLVGPLGASESRFDLELPTLAMTRE